MTRTETMPRAGAPRPKPLALMLALTLSVGGADASIDLQRWQTTLPRYAADPAGNRAEVLALGRDGTDGLPPVFGIVLADAHLRAGHLRTAGRLFDEVLAANPGEPWAGFAALGRGWTATRRGDLETARSAFDDASAAPGETGLLGDLMTGMVDAADGAVAQASERFARVVDAPLASEHLQIAALMADGYARFWSGDDAGARAAFERVTERAPQGGVADDARYAAALAQWRQGDRAGAEAALRTLAAERGRDQDRSSAGVANLDPRSIIRAGAKRYRRLPLGAPSKQLLGTLDLDAPSAARASLRRLEAGAAPPAPIQDRRRNREGVRTAAPSGRVDTPASGRDVASTKDVPTASVPTPAPHPIERRASSAYLWAAAIATLLFAAAWWWLSRSSAQPDEVR